MSSRLVASRVNYAVETLAPLLAESRAEARTREIEGAEKLPRERRPVLAVSAHHHLADLWQLPTLAAELTEDYLFYLRAHRPDGFDCVLYAIPAERAAP
jgi:hypothetical protein